MTLKYCSLEYTRSDNLGDEIQSLAAEQFLPRVDGFVDRDTGLHAITEPTLLILNGWFKHGPAHWRDGATECWPPSSYVRPVFFGFHVSYPELLTKGFLDYCRPWQPIGCRDKGTAELLQHQGIDATFTRCVTLTFPRRVSEPMNGRVYIVEGQKRVDRDRIPDDIRRDAVCRNHYVDHKYLENTRAKRTMAMALLEEYRSHARLVVTNLLHCAMPCTAMGIPVVLMTDPDPLYPKGSRFDPIRGIIPIYEAGDTIDWNPSAPDITNTSETIRRNLRDRMRVAWDSDVEL